MTGKREMSFPFFKKGRREDPGKNRAVSFTSVPGKVVEWVLLEVMLRHMQDKELIQGCQNGFIEG